MITEDYVSFETAKLLKEKGFNEYCRAFRSPSGKLFYSSHDIKNFEDGKTIGAAIAAPTLQMAMKWLREVHNIAIVVTPSIFWGKYNVSIYKKGNDYPYGFDGGDLVPSYEQACEAAIKYYLEHLIE